MSDPALIPPPPAGAVGFPERAAEMDALPGFRQPPAGYGQVPFYWWVGDPLTRERLAWQLERLDRCGGITGLQINYAHGYRDGGLQWGLSLPSAPPLFSDAWWELVAWFMDEAKRRGWSVSLSDYTLGPGQGWCFDELLREHPEMTGAVLRQETRDVAAGEVEWTLPPDLVSLMAYPLAGESMVPGGAVDLRAHVANGVLKWRAPGPSVATKAANCPASAGSRANVVGVHASACAFGGGFDDQADTLKCEPQLRRPSVDLVGVHASACPASGPTKPCYRLIAVTAPPVALSLDPMHPDSGRLYAEKFFGQFAERFPGECGKGLNFFFSDELNFNVQGNLWTSRFPEEFRRRKGYDLIPELPALFLECGPRTPKIRLDYRDVMVALEEEAFFKPVFDWHQQRGMIYGCDHGGRGRDVVEFGDYFRTQRWNQGPGCDQPDLACDLIKNKVASSIAHLYLRPRVWLEGYYGSGWGTSTAGLTRATFANFAQGQNLLSLHGLYYTTHGGFWEWAPPCNHFRMPYWAHMDTFLAMVQRLSYLLSQGHHCCDVAILYPVAPMEAGVGGKEAVAAAFDAGRALYAATIDFDFMDFESLARAEIADRELRVSGERYRVLVLPALRAIRWSTLTKALAFHRAGGLVLALGALPEASDRAGAADPELDAIVQEIFGRGANVMRTPQELAAIVAAAIPPDFVVRAPTGSAPNFIHRRIGPRDVYMIHGAPPGAECLFRATGSVELWDPWTGNTQPLPVCEQTIDHTRLRLPLTEHDAQLIVFTAQAECWGKPYEERFFPKAPFQTFSEPANSTRTVRSGRDNPTRHDVRAEFATRESFRKGVRRTTLCKGFPPTVIPLAGEWEFELIPTMDNRFGDFRWPPSPGFIGGEARRFRYAEEAMPNPGWEKPYFDDAAWPTVTHGFGPKFWKLGPLPDGLELDAQLAGFTTLDPAIPVEIGGASYGWQPYAFSWRWGVEGDPGRQGWHGLKENVSDDFIILGARGKSRGVGAADYEYLPEPGGHRYYLWTTAVAATATAAEIRAGGDLPAAAYLNGERIDAGVKRVALNSGANPLLLRYDQPGRGHFVLEVPNLKGKCAETALPDRLKPGHQPVGVHASACPASGAGALAMSWHSRSGVVPFDVHPGEPRPAGWYRFTAPPGLRALSLQAYGRVRAWVDGKEVAGKSQRSTSNAESAPINRPRPQRSGPRTRTASEHRSTTSRTSTSTIGQELTFWSELSAQHPASNVGRRTPDVEPVSRCPENRSPDTDHRLPITWRFELPTPARRAAVVALRIEPADGNYGGAALPVPVQCECGPGLMPLGDWSQAGVLECYSGGAWYRKCVSLTPEQAAGGVVLDLGQVVASAEVHVNGQLAGVRIAPPWRVDLSTHVRAGENRIEVLVYNTLANHYLTIPTGYRGELESGLLGPVVLEFTAAGVR